MKYLKPLFSGVIIGLIMVAITFSTTNTVELINNKSKWSNPTEYLPKVKVPDVIANRIVKSVEAKLNN